MSHCSYMAQQTFVNQILALFSPSCQFPSFSSSFFLIQNNIYTSFCLIVFGTFHAYVDSPYVIFFSSYYSVLRHFNYSTSQKNLKGKGEILPSQTHFKWALFLPLLVTVSSAGQWAVFIILVDALDPHQESSNSPN